MTVNEILSEIQVKLNAPKNNKNTFGNYNYRSCEDILVAVKPLLNGATLVINDEIILIGERYYVKATASLFYDGVNSSASAYAREPFDQKGMSMSQLTGSASSYARKYALGGLFALDDNKDADTMDNRPQQKAQQSQPKKLMVEWQKVVFTKMLEDLAKVEGSEVLLSIDLIKENLTVWSEAEANSWIKKIKGKYGV